MDFYVNTYFTLTSFQILWTELRKRQIIRLSEKNAASSFGKAFIDAPNVCKSTLSSYICAVRRLDDYIDGKPYRCRHDDPKFEAPPEFSDILTEYLHECEQSGNKTPTVLSKERTCVSFLNQVALNGCFDLSKLDAGIITRALLVLSNKDNYARVRQFLQYLAVEGITKVDFSGIVPHYKRRETKLCYVLCMPVEQELRKYVTLL